MELILQGISKSFGAQAALRNIDLSLSGNGIVALLGPNGSGKSTLLRLLATSIRADTGRISFGSHVYRPDLSALRRVIGYLPQELDLPRHMTPLKLLEYLARLKEVHDRDQIESLLYTLNLEQVASRLLSELSSGQVRLVGIAQALLGSPKLLLLDELMRGLDLPLRNIVARILRKRAQNGLVIFSSHVAAEVEPLAEKLIVLRRGEMVYSGEVNALRMSARQHVHELRVSSSHVSSMFDQCIVSRNVQHNGTSILRVVGDLPPGYDAIRVEPALEDAYLLLQRDAINLA